MAGNTRSTADFGSIPGENIVFNARGSPFDTGDRTPFMANLVQMNRIPRLRPKGPIVYEKVICNNRRDALTEQPGTHTANPPALNPEPVQHGVVTTDDDAVAPVSVENAGAGNDIARPSVRLKTAE